MVKFNYLFSFYNFLLFAQSNKKYKFYERSRVEIEKIKRKLLAGIEKRKKFIIISVFSSFAVEELFYVDDRYGGVIMVTSALPDLQ